MRRELSKAITLLRCSDRDVGDGGAVAYRFARCPVQNRGSLIGDGVIHPDLDSIVSWRHRRQIKVIHVPSRR